MKKKLYIATVAETDGDGRHYGAIYTDSTAEKVCDKVLKYLRTEEQKYSGKINYDESDILAACITGNEKKGPEIFQSNIGNGTEYVIYTKVKELTITGTVKKYLVTELFCNEGDETAHSLLFNTADEANAHIMGSYNSLFSEGIVNDPAEFPGMFHDTPREALCDGMLDMHVNWDHITVWDDRDHYYEGAFSEVDVNIMES